MPRKTGSSRSPLAKNWHFRANEPNFGEVFLRERTQFSRKADVLIGSNPDQLGSRQAIFNASSRGQWEGFAEHRMRLTAVLTREPAEQSSLCVLGVGNANDLDLPALLASYREVHLADIDAESLRLGTERQGVAGHPRLRIHGGLDLSGTLGILSDKTPISELAPADFEALANWPASHVAPFLPGPFDRVVSTCMISQILETAAHAIGPNHRQLADAESAMRAGHLRLMTRLTAPGGEALLIAEILSTDTCPNLPELPQEQFPGLLQEVTRDGRHFRGVHPRQLLAALRSDSVLAPLVSSATPLPPWRWRLHHRTYLVGALNMRRAAR